mmetsp:Transcript_18853/g.27736  ORF Transcript_18853/g.27736 Transcript_18853/m.27736 type:complete len:87 (+) Transcript_18853:154-414(+)
MDTPSLLQFSFSTFLDSLEHAGKICRVPVFLPITVDGLAAAESSGVVFQRGVAQTSRYQGHAQAVASQFQKIEQMAARLLRARTSF